MVTGQAPWFGFRWLRGPWEVRLVDPGACDALREGRGHLEGKMRYQPKEGGPSLILLNAALSPARQAETLIHELLHAALIQTRLPAMLEEWMVEALDGPLSRLLQALGFHPPPKPEAAAQLERRARRRAAKDD